HLRRLVQQLVEEENLEDYLVWFYTPMALPVSEVLQPAAVVYDCMDELSAFLGAPPELLEREEQLLQKADVVFTGGPSLFRAKQNRHPNVHCFPSSVDAGHFAKANQAAEAPDQAPLPRPRLGYFGVIDERMDLGLLDAMSQAHPEWQIVLVGPVAKVDGSVLPRRPNIHYLGQPSYSELPAYVAGWDVCLLPFALNDATRFISPTKTLEYMAAERPIVSAPITDISDPYGQIVHLGGTHSDFIAACERALRWPETERIERVSRMREVLSKTSWDATAWAMEQQIAKILDSPIRCESPGVKRRVIVAGAGPTGLSAAFHLGEDALVIEPNDRVGGCCRSIEDRGFTFDHAGHIMFSNDPHVHEMYKILLGDNVHWQDREAWIYSKKVFTRYPFQGSLYGLPPSVIKE